MGFAKKRPFLIALIIGLAVISAHSAKNSEPKSDAVSDAFFSVLAGPVSAVNKFFSLFGGAGKTPEINERPLAIPQAVAELKKENRRLRMLLKLAEKTQRRWIAASIAGATPSPFSYKILILDKGANDGIRQGMPVIAQVGGEKTLGAIVGRILKSHRRASQAIVITDPASSVDAFTGRSGERGVVKGDGKGCIMDYIAADADIKTGDIVLSSGRDGVYPRGILIGKIGRIYSGSGIKKAQVIPAADPYSLEEVLTLEETAKIL